jgi:hypothetical protein
MHTPDAGRIRVRWYAIPEQPPGVYALGDYQSSNFDGDTLSLDPAIGEESSTRDPYSDWRDCSPPPWPEPDGAGCPYAAGPVWLYYDVPAITLYGQFGGPYAFGAKRLVQVLPCRWYAEEINPFVTIRIWVLEVQPNGTWTLTLTAADYPGPTGGLVTWSAPAGLDPFGPIRLNFSSSTLPPLTGPGTVVVKGKSRGILATGSGVPLGTGSGYFITTGP